MSNDASAPESSGKGLFWVCVALLVVAVGVGGWLGYKYVAQSEILALKEKELGVNKFEIEDLVSKCSVADQDAKKAQRELASTKSQVAALESERDALSKAVESKVGKANETLVAAKKELEACRGRELESQKLKDECEKKSATVQQSVAALQQSVEECNKTVAVFEAGGKNSTDEVGQCREILIAVQKDLAACRQTMIDLQTSDKQPPEQGLSAVQMDRLQVELEACLRKPSAPLEAAPPDVVPAPLLLSAQAEAAAAEKRVQEATATYDALLERMKKEIQEKDVAIERFKDMIKITIVGKILFDTASVAITAKGHDLLDKLSPTLKSIKEKNIYVMGHTDSQTINPRFTYKFPTNWELSGARAAAVVRYLMDKSDIEPAQLAAVGRASYVPSADNESELGRARNRRVEILIAPAL